MGWNQEVGRAAAYDIGDSHVAAVSRLAPAGAMMQQVAQDVVAPLQPISSSFWEDKSMGRGRKRHPLAEILRRVPFVGSWGGLL